jgi:hypothetical protein
LDGVQHFASCRALRRPALRRCRQLRLLYDEGSTTPRLA